MQRKYNVIVINEKTGKKVVITSSPVTHGEGCVILGKLSKHSWRRELLEEVVV